MDPVGQRFMQLPTHPQLKVVTSADARAALFLVECLQLQPVRRRPDDAEKAQISHGQVFIWLDGAKGETGLERWTDGRSWGPSRCRDDFLIYEEKSGEHKLTKSTYTARRNTHGDPGALWHLIAYYYADETHTLIDMYTDPTFSRYTLEMPAGYFVSNRKDKSRKAKEVPPPVDSSHLSQYAELVASLTAVVSPTTTTAQQSNNNTSSPHSHGYHQHQHHHSYSHQHPYTHTNSMSNGSPRLERERISHPSPNSAAASLVSQYENFSITNNTSLDRLQHARLSSISSLDEVSPSSVTRRRQELPPLKTSFFSGSNSKGHNANNDDEQFDRYSNEDPALHALTRHTMHDPKQYKKVFAADYHRLPPPSGFQHVEGHYGGGGGPSGGGGGGEPHVRGRTARGASVPIVMSTTGGVGAAAAGTTSFYSSSPSPSSSSPGLSPTSSGSSPIEADMEMDIDQPSSYHHRHGMVRTSREREATVVAPTPVRAYSNSPATPHATLNHHHHSLQSALPHHLNYREPYTPSGAGMSMSLPRAMSLGGGGGGSVGAPSPAPAVAIPSSGSQTFERGGVGMMMIDMASLSAVAGATGGAPPVRSREDEKALHQFSKTWTALF